MVISWLCHKVLTNSNVWVQCFMGFGWNLFTKYKPVVLNGTDRKKSGRSFTWKLSLAPDFFMYNGIDL